MKIIYLDSVSSTQNFLKELVRKKNIEIPHAVVANAQTSGVGSRGNFWEGMEGNLFLSFALSLEELPDDLPLESISIYFAYLLKDTLKDLNSQVWLKWPNDFYIQKLKMGGMITNITKEILICGVGLNITVAPEGFTKLDIKVKRETILNSFFKKIKKKTSWKQIFSKYELEFYKNQNFFTHKNNLKISLEGAKLQSDGSIISNGERIYSLR